ncbi:MULTISPECIES: CU044_5270 family protein [Streptomyces]|uniref:2-oxoglutarate dehydrogenase n=2 Tax=Streptomyces rimosus subsp. rimosus TaxID=132474 RepID=L8EPR4_STRR1|nr:MULTISPECIES: CU044_5270 family protein [Streptomyces]KOG84074.1 2-oxoglutarate dehydrogenase [Kitasatospora aureofaciens]MYT46661.1 2-oxoglutarate dehydrogenase [Streptomyces sp. SID5471]KEF07503.1 2-oxoglutarate dehydrogenase [Streptomyces rimosus]KEF20461.1 2-oxoglutarate dehydrogenase [Streptomyces rimosus]KOT28015.1 2-oxoglutarate dehydrogenase [Streptomyces sp. NRRL WC-3701]
MTDELELLRQADPVRSDQGPWRDRPLTARAEHRLAALMSAEAPERTPDPAPAPERPGRTTRAPRPTRRTRRLLIGATAASAAVLAVLTLTFSGAGTTPAAAAPTALVVQRDAPAVPLDEVARQAEAYARAQRDAPKPHRGSHLQSWYLSMQTGPDAKPPVTVPEERITRWNPDGSGSELVVATDPRHPGRPVINDADGEWRTVNDGKVLHRKTYPAGTRLDDLATGEGTLPARPPADPDELRAYLATFYSGAGTKTQPLLMALSSFLQEWTPGPRESAALARMLSRAPDLRPAGQVVDRLGRRGQAYAYRGEDASDGSMDGTLQLVILDPETGRVLGMETTFTKNVPDFKIKSGDVLSYEAWMP